MNVNQNLNSYWIHFLSGYLSTKHFVKEKEKKKKKSKLTFSSWTRSSPLAWISILITAVFSSSAKINAHENQDPEYQIYWLWWAANHPGPCKTPLTPSPMIQAIESSQQIAQSLRSVQDLRGLPDDADKSLDGPLSGNQDKTSTAPVFLESMVYMSIRSHRGESKGRIIYRGWNRWDI